MRGYEDTKGRDQGGTILDATRGKISAILQICLLLSNCSRGNEKLRERERGSEKRMEKYWQIAGETRRANAGRRMVEG